MTVKTYSIHNLPNGCVFYPARSELVIHCPIAEKGKMTLLPMHMITPSPPQNLFGRWTVSADGLSASSQQTTKTVDSLIQEYISVASAMVALSIQQQEDDPAEISKRRWENIKTLAPFAALGALMIACVLIWSIIMGHYAPIWFT